MTNDISDKTNEYANPEKKLIVSFSVAILLVIIISVLTTYYTNRYLLANKWVEHTNKVLYESEQTVSSAKDVILKNHSYLLTGKQMYLDQFKQVCDETYTHIQHLKELTAENQEQQKRVDSLNYFLAGRITFSNEAVETFNKSGLDSALHLLTSAKNKKYLAEIRTIISEIQAEETRLLARREEQNNQYIATFKNVLLALLVSAITLLVLVFLMMRYTLKTHKAAVQKTRELNTLLEQRVAERTAEVNKNEQMFRALVENTHDIISLVDKNFKTIYSSPAGYRVTGWSLKEMQELKRGQQVHPDDAETMKVLGQKVLENPGMSVPYSLRFLHKQGHYIWLEGTMTNLLADKSVNAIVFNTRDVSNKKRSEELLRLSEGRLSAIIEQFPQPIITYRADGATISANRAWEIMWDDKRENVVDYNIRKDPQLAASGLSKYVEKAFAGEVALSEPYEYDPSLIGKKGRKRWIQMLLFPYKNKSGEVLEVVLVLQDITYNKEAEEEIKKLNEQLEVKVKDRTTQLEAANKELEAFSYSVSHDLRAPLRAVNGFARILKEDYGQVLDGEGSRLLGVIRENAQRMGLLIDDLLAFSRLGRQDLKKTQVDMNEIFLNALAEINRNVSHKATVKINHLPHAMADSSLMAPVVINLLSNAIKYSSTVQHPNVEVTSYTQDDELVFKVTDNGVGFEMEYANKLFGVFQRLHTNDEFEGTGVGLAIVHRIIQKHHGRVWAEGKVGEGASFYFTLPYSSHN